MQHTWTIGFILLLRASVAQGQAPAASPQDLPNYLEVNPRLGTGGQPSDRGFQILKDKGYKAIINLRTANEGVDLAAEEKRAREMGMRYIGIPVVSADPKEEQALDFLRYMDELKDEKTFVHCASANRVGGFLLIQQVLKGGAPPEKAEEEAKRIGLRSEVLRKFAKDFIEKHKK